MIPKIIHYCWFGPKEMPEQEKKYLESWKKYCPDYKLMCWSEDTFDITSNLYVKEAYENRKYAFVTDYVRLYAMYNYGGIYMDTDVEVCKNMDELLQYPAFSGFESDNKIPTGTMGAEKGNPWIGLLLKDYESIRFIRPNGTLDMVTNTERITSTTLQNYSIKLEGIQLQTDDFVMLPFEYLCAKDWQTDKIIRTDNTYTIHHFANSWQSNKVKVYGKFRRTVKKSKNPVLKIIDRLLDNAVAMVKK